MSLYIFTVRQQSDNAYLPPYSTQRPPEKPRPFQPAINQQESAYSPSQNEVTNYPYQRPSSLYTPANIPHSLPPNVDASSHGLSTASTLYGSPTSLRPSTTYIPQDNYGSSPTFSPRPQPSYGPTSSTLPPFGGTTGTSNYPSAGTTRPGTFPSSTPSTSQSSTYLPPQYSGFPSSNPRYAKRILSSSSPFMSSLGLETIRTEPLSYIL